MKVPVAALTIAMALFASAAPASADTEQDSRFLNSLRNAGWSITNSSGLITQGRQVCDNGLALGFSASHMYSEVRRSYSPRDASTLVKQAIYTYCPKYAAEATRVPSGGPTKGDLNNLAAQLDNRGLYVKYLDQVLISICDYKANPIGFSTRDIANAVLASSGLSLSEAMEVVGYAQTYC